MRREAPLKPAVLLDVRFLNIFLHALTISDYANYKPVFKNAILYFSSILG
jgi:hypothetical protein